MTHRITTITHGADGIRLTRDNGSVTRYSAPLDVAEALARSTYFSDDCQALIVKFRQAIGAMPLAVCCPSNKGWLRIRAKGTGYRAACDCGEKWEGK